MIDILTAICNKIWKTGEWPTTWIQSLVITLPKKGNLQLCQNYRTISLISHPSKVMLKIILNRLQPQAEEKSTQVSEPEGAPQNKFNLRILCEKYLQHQQNLHYVFTDFKKAFDRVWLMRTLILSNFLYAYESWTLTAEIERRIALEMRCYRRLLNISCKDHVTNEEVRNRIQNAIGVHDDLLTVVKKLTLRWYGHISRSSGIAKTVL